MLYYYCMFTHFVSIIFWFLKNATDNKPHNYFFSAFREAVRAIGRTILVMLPIEDPIPLTRAWCVWEIFCTVDSGAELRVALPPSERSKFDDILLHRFQVWDMLATSGHVYCDVIYYEYFVQY